MYNYVHLKQNINALVNKLINCNCIYLMISNGEINIFIKSYIFWSHELTYIAYQLIKLRPLLGAVSSVLHLIVLLIYC